MKQKLFLIFILISFIILAAYLYFYKNKNAPYTFPNMQTDQPELQDDGGMTSQTHPLSIESLKQKEYPGSDIVIEQELGLQNNYARYIASYKSDGLKIYALLTVPNSQRPESGWPVIIFNHGYIPPLQYSTTEKYSAYVDGFARNGYIVFKPDYRGHGNSEGSPEGAYGSNAYTIDVLNAVASIKKYKDADQNRIGMWGHSMGGHITLRNMVVSADIKAGVIWAGVIGSYEDLLNNWRRKSTTPPPSLPTGARRWRDVLVEQYGTPQQNPKFWKSISAHGYLADISGPLQLHHGTLDASVPVNFSISLDKQLTDISKTAELYTYDGDDHNLSKSFGTAMRRSIEFFDKYVKNSQ